MLLHRARIYAIEDLKLPKSLDGVFVKRVEEVSTRLKGPFT
jgi:hypothetical protein